MRRGEVCGLKWKDLDLAGMLGPSPPHLGVVDGKPVLGTPKSRRSRRTIDLDERTVEILLAHREHQAEAAEFVGDGWHHSDYVFTTVIGTHTHPTTSASASPISSARPTSRTSPCTGSATLTPPTSWRWARTPGWSANASATPTSPSPSRSTATPSRATNAKQRRRPLGSWTSTAHHLPGGRRLAPTLREMSDEAGDVH